MVRQRTGEVAEMVSATRRGGRSMTVVVLIAAAAACLGVGIVIGHSIAASQVREATAEATAAREDLERLADAHETLQERNWILYLEAEKYRAAAAEEPAGPVSPDGAYSDGVYEVGTDIQPGAYRGEVNGEFGYWARLNGTSGMVSGIVANSVVRGPFVLTIPPSDAAVELRGVTITLDE